MKGVRLKFKAQWILAFGFRLEGVGYRALELQGFGALGLWGFSALGFRALGFRVWGLGLKVSVSRARVHSTAARGLRLQVWGFKVFWIRELIAVVPVALVGFRPTGIWASAGIVVAAFQIESESLWEQQQ